MPLSPYHLAASVLRSEFVILGTVEDRSVAGC
jgi:hypothetical protein